MSEVSGEVALELLPDELPKPNGKPALELGPVPKLPVADLASFVGSVSEGEGAEPLRFGLGCARPSLGDDSFEGNLGVKE